MSRNSQLKTPVVLIIFKRPHTTQKVFETIRQAKPSKLFVIANAPRSNRPDEAEKCEAARAIIEQVDWECEVIKNYSETHLSCKERISSGLNWVFEQVEEAIILEDDVVPHPTFFCLCEELLERYKYDNRIFSISAQNVQLGHRRTEDSYYFSRYWHGWGWATWRRAWQHYDIEMKQWEKVKARNLLQYILMDTQAAKYWTELFQRTYDKQIDTWDYQWTLSCWLQSGLSIIPDVNMISHIGFDADATHNVKKDNKNVDTPVEAVEFPLKHPPFVIRDAIADNFTQRVAFEGGFLRQFKSNIKKLITHRVR